MKNGGTKMNDKENQRGQEIDIPEFISHINEVARTAWELTKRTTEDHETRMEVIKNINAKNIHNIKFLIAWLKMTVDAASMSQVMSIISCSTEEGMSFRKEIAAWAEEAGLGEDTMISFGIQPYFGEE